MSSSKRNKSKAWIGTLLFHSLLILLFFFTGLSYTIPPPPEEGISINFGNSEFAKGETENQQEKFEEIIEETSQEVISTDEIITQESIETVETKKEEKKEEKEKNQEVMEKMEIEEITKENIEEKVINKRAIYNPNKNKKNTGNTRGDGTIGKEVGDQNSTNYTGGDFGYGLSEIGSYRSKPESLNHPLEMGKGYITINVIVNAEGKIIDIDDSSFYSTLGYVGSFKRKNLFIAIKQQLKYGPATGNDKSDKIAKLKLIFTH
ncbi:MAG: hypothetical protein CMD02_03860 [Flavobacteriales bacterium]|nr:hypothetical protein [Flavobacteriales bacterium]